MTLDRSYAAARRHVRRPLAWVGPALVAASLLLLADWRDARQQERDLRRALPVAGVVEASYEGGHEVPVRYHNPVTDVQVTATAWVEDEGFLPRAGAPVDLLVAPEDPWEVTLAGDRPSPPLDFMGYAALPALPVGVWLLRWRTIRKMAALLRDPGPRFAMFGALQPPGKLGQRRRLHLYPLDALPGAPSLSAVALLDSADVPANVAFVVKVKGVPAPGGRVIVRAGERTLWPAGRTLLAAKFPRPSTEVAPAGFAVRTHDPFPEGGRRTTARIDFLALAGAATLAAVVAVGTLRTAEREEALERRSVPVVARVVDRDDGAVLLAYRVPGDAGPVPRLRRAPTVLPSEYYPERRYPARVDPHDPDRVRLAREEYDSFTPIMAGSLPLAVAGVRIVRRRWSHRRKSYRHRPG